MLESPQPVKKATYSIGGKGWYAIPGWRDGDRTIEQQITGLDRMPIDVRGKEILELGCAEGVMSRWFVDTCKAHSVHGIEIVPGHVDLGKKWCKHRRIKFEVANCDTWRPRKAVDVVVALALLHKLQDPIRCLDAVCAVAREMVVLRLPSACEPWIIKDARTEFQPFDVSKVLKEHGFDLVDSTMGPFDEPTGFWRRK